MFLLFTAGPQIPPPPVPIIQVIAPGGPGMNPQAPGGPGMNPQAPVIGGVAAAAANAAVALAIAGGPI